jgi:ubiquinone/menaquinone biosynthesis C-methylase UbiE
MFENYSEIFTKRGAAYHLAMSKYPAARSHEFKTVISFANLSKGAIVADMPSGGGYCSNYLPKDITLIAIDESQAFLEQGNESANCKKICAKLNDTNLEDASVDSVISIAGLHHITDKKSFFKETMRILKPGGTLIIADAEEGSKTALFLDQFVSKYNSMGHSGLYLNNQSAQDIRETGFTITHNKAVNYPWIFASIPNMAEYCKLLFGLDRACELKELADVISKYLKVEQSGDSTWMHWSLFFIQARKPIK